MITRVGLVVMVSWGAVSTASGAPPEDVVRKVEAVQRSALASSPMLAERLREAAVLGAEARSEAAAINPYLEWQSEGLAGDRTPNAQDSLRLGTPFNFFGQIGPARDLEETARLGTGVLQSAASQEVAVEAARRWLELASAVATEAVRRARVERFDDALNMLEARRQLGEVAGTVVLQLELEHTTAVSQLAASERAVAAASEAVREVCGEGYPRPHPGDLEALVAATATPSRQRVDSSALTDGLPMQVISSQASLEDARARMAAATAWGRPEIEAEWEHFPTLDGVESYDAWGFRIAVPLPFGSAGNRQRESARERQALAAAAREAAVRRVLREAEASLTSAESAERGLRAVEDVLPNLEGIDASLAAQYRLGALTYLEYIYGVSRHDDMLLSAIQFRAELLSARLRLAMLLDDRAVFPLPVVSQEDVS